MKIHYQDEYGEQIGVPDIMPFLPLNGDIVVVDGEDWYVKSRTFYNGKGIVVTVTHAATRTSSAEPAPNDRLGEANSAIIAVNKRQDANEKKTRSLNEQIASVRKHINQQIQKDKKDTQ